MRWGCSDRIAPAHLSVTLFIQAEKEPGCWRTKRLRDAPQRGASINWCSGGTQNLLLPQMCMLLSPVCWSRKIVWMELCQWCVYVWSHSRTPEHLLFVFDIFHQRQEFLICNIIILVLPTVSRGVFKALDQILGLNKIAKLTVSYTWISFSVKCLVIIPQRCPVTHTQARMSTSTEAWPECWMQIFKEVFRWVEMWCINLCTLCRWSASSWRRRASQRMGFELFWLRRITCTAECVTHPRSQMAAIKMLRKLTVSIWLSHFPFHLSR